MRNINNRVRVLMNHGIEIKAFNGKFYAGDVSTLDGMVIVEWVEVETMNVLEFLGY